MIRILEDKVVDTDKCTTILHTTDLYADHYYLKTVWGTYVHQTVPLGYRAISNPNLIQMELISEDAMKELLKEKDAEQYLKLFGDKGLSEA
ncbi:MAG: hypothetical protein IKZ00_10105 [Bacteroidaceae bacterium]|nr:hypothetical protein [Bacteroidaceae bacterium]